ncbi:MAG: hypothetical protein WED09_03840 [Homoserinimonas sp.]
MATASAHKAHSPAQAHSAQQAPLAPAPVPALTWTHIPLVPQVALVGHLNDMPVAVIDQIGGAGFRASLCSGTSVGVFRTLDECKQAVSAAIEKARKNAASA